MSKLKIPKKIEMRSIHIHATNKDNHVSYIHIHGIEHVKTSLGIEEMDRDFKHIINLKFHVYGSNRHHITPMDSYRIYLKDFNMETFLTLFCDQKSDNLTIDFYVCNNSTMLDNAGLIQESLFIHGDNHKIVINDVYNPDNHYFTSFTYQDSGYTDYDQMDAIEI